MNNKLHYNKKNLKIITTINVTQIILIQNGDKHSQVILKLKILFKKKDE